MAIPVPRGRANLSVRGKRKPDFAAGLGDALARLEAKTGHRLTEEQKVIGENETFVEWCERLGREGMKVDGKPFRLDDRPAMRWVYAKLPSRIEDAKGRTIVFQKPTQIGFSLMETAVQPFFEMRLISATHASMSHVGMMPHGMNRPG